MHHLQIDVLRERISSALGDRLVELRRMLGGQTFLLNGNMLSCVSKSGPMARVGAEAQVQALKRPLAARCLGSGREGFLVVPHIAVESDAELRTGFDVALAYVERLPPRDRKARRTTACRSRGGKSTRKGQ